MVEKQQKARFSQIELLSLQKAFKNDEELLYVLRKYLLDLQIPEEDYKRLKKIGLTALKTIKRNFLPQISDDTRLELQAHIMLFKEIMQMTPDMSYLYTESKLIFSDYFDQKFDELMNNEINGQKIELKNLFPKRGQEREERHINLTAWSSIVANIDIRLSEIQVFANTPGLDETDEDKEKKLQKNSNK